MQLEKFQGADFKYDISIFKILDQKYPNEAFLVKNTQKRHRWCQTEAFLFLRETLPFDKFEDDDFKKTTGIFGQKYANKFFLASNLGFLLFSKNLQLDKLEEVDFKYDNSFLKF